MQVFIDYFDREFWGNKTGSSGPNSDPDLTPILRDNLLGLLLEYEIKSIVDAGCGDCNLFKNMDIATTKYIGVEVVPKLTELNIEVFKLNHNMSFQTLDVVNDKLPEGELILCRDVVHYLPNELISKFLLNCKASGAKYLLVTHNTHSELSANCATELGIFRPVNLSQYPFHLEPITTIKEDVFAKRLALFEL